MLVSETEQPECEEAKRGHEQFFSTTLDVGGLFLVADSECLVVLDTGAAANLGRFRWREQHNRVLKWWRYRKVSAYPSSAQFRFGDGRGDEVRHAADTLVGIPGSKGEFSAFALDADIPA